MLLTVSALEGADRPLGITYRLNSLIGLVLELAKQPPNRPKTETLGDQSKGVSGGFLGIVSVALGQAL